MEHFTGFLTLAAIVLGGVAMGTLAARLSRWSTPGKRFHAPVPGLSLFQILQPTPPLNVIIEPSIYLVAQFGASPTRDMAE